MNIQTRHVFKEHSYRFHKEINFDLSTIDAWRESAREEYYPFLESFFGNEDVIMDIFGLISELTKNTFEHSENSSKAILQVWDSSDSLLLCYWEERTTFYNSKKVKEKLESGIKIPTQKESKGGYGIPTILDYPRTLFIDTKQEVIFLDIEKPYKI